MSTAIDTWHHIFETKEFSRLDDLLDDNVVFHSPVVHTPQEGKSITKLYLSAADSVLNNGNFKYVRKIIGERDAMLEFETEIDGVHFNGVDIIKWNDDNKIIDFKVMVRPLKAIQAIHAAMGAMLAQVK